MKVINAGLWALFFVTFFLGCQKQEVREVVIYTSLDQVFSEPVLQKYEADTGVKVKAVYDVEATKTTGLVNRLIAEKSHPQADVFWNSEVGRTLILKEKEILAPYRSPSASDIPAQFKDPEGYWTGFAARARVLIVNTDMVSEEEMPKSIFEFTQPRWSGQVALAYPLFGTTATHAAALFEVMGDEKALEYYNSLKANGVVIVDGNSTSRDMVQDGQIKCGFTDTDDANVAIQNGKPVKMIYPDVGGIGTLMIPNTVALVKGAPHEEEGKKLIDYLLSREVESLLAHCESAQMPVRPGVKSPDHVPDYSSIKATEVSYEAIARRMEPTGKIMREMFVR